MSHVIATDYSGQKLHKTDLSRVGNGPPLTDLGVVGDVTDLAGLLQNGYTEGQSVAGIAYRIGHFVRIEGVLHIKTGASADDVMFTLPAALRPIQDTYVTMNATDGSGYAVALIDDATGTVKYKSGTENKNYALEIGFLDPYGTR
ncbi:MAG: hypothetical protein QOJ29_57 [Thermoleophilaceae bacterium]|jgi:hypothetical protein|nr:hypothetical protein [Thermoleophilaceae bacterium]